MKTIVTRKIFNVVEIGNMITYMRQLIYSDGSVVFEAVYLTKREDLNQAAFI